MKKCLFIFIISLFILPLQHGYGQACIEDSIIIKIVNRTIQSHENDTIYKPNGTIWKIKENHTPEIVLVNETETFLFDPKVYTLEMFNSNGLSLLDSVTYNDFILKNKKSIIIPEIENTKASIHILTKEELNKIFDSGGWEKYHRKYKYNPIVKISRSGINKEQDLAFIYYSATSGALAGAGFYVILKKENEKWIEKEYWLAWIA